MPWEIVGLVLAALIGAGPGVLALWEQKRKTGAEATRAEAEAAGELTETALSLVKPMREQIAKLQDEVRELTDVVNNQGWELTKLRTENNLLREGAGRLVLQVQSLNGAPVFEVKKRAD